jgi:hypothetical protein
MSYALSQEQQADHALVQREIALAGEFAKRYLAQRAAKDDNGNIQGHIAAFDSVTTIETGDRRGEKEMGVLPTSLQSLFDSVGSDEGRSLILRGMEIGIQQYQNANGGDMPSDALIASGLSAGALALNQKDKAHILKPMFDSLSYDHAESLSIVPSVVLATIATRIATGLPIISYLPNPMGSNEVPVVYARTVANKDWGAMAANDYLDGSKAAHPYVDSRRQFAMSNGGSGLVYTVTPRVHYLSYSALTPDTGSIAAPFLGGRVRILVNGVEVAHDRSKDHPTKTGTSTLQAVQGVTLESTAILLASGSASLSTHLITATFTAALPAGAVVTAEIILDFERKDSAGTPILGAAGVDILLEGKSIYAYPVQSFVYASVGAMSNIQRELNIDARAAGVAMVQAKFYLEQTVYLLKQAKAIGKAYGRTLPFDASRGVTGGAAAAYNTSAQLMSEFKSVLGQAKIAINKDVGNSISTFDLYCTDKGSILFGRLAELKGYTEIPNIVGSADAITRIGYFDDGTNVYHVPSQNGLFDETTTSAEVMVIARSSDPAKSMFVGFTAVPPILRDFDPTAFEQGVAIYSRNAADINPLSRFGQQVAVINMTNLPSF